MINLSYFSVGSPRHRVCVKVDLAKKIVPIGHVMVSIKDCFRITRLGNCLLDTVNIGVLKVAVAYVATPNVVTLQNAVITTFCLATALPSIGKITTFCNITTFWVATCVAYLTESVLNRKWTFAD